MGEPSLKAAVMRLQRAGCPALAKKGPVATRLGLQVFDYHGEMVSKITRSFRKNHGEP